jgi:hypothetical protein
MAIQEPQLLEELRATEAGAVNAGEAKDVADVGGADVVLDDVQRYAAFGARLPEVGQVAAVWDVRELNAGARDFERDCLGVAQCAEAIDHAERIFAPKRPTMMRSPRDIKLKSRQALATFCWIELARIARN